MRAAPSASRTRYELCYGRRDDIENDNKKGTIRPTSHTESSLVLLCPRVIIMQRCLKKETGQTPSLALIVAVTEVNPRSHQCDLHILHLLSCPSVGLCGWWGCCPNLSKRQLQGYQLLDSEATSMWKASMLL